MFIYAAWCQARLPGSYSSRLECRRNKNLVNLRPPALVERTPNTEEIADTPFVARSKR